MVLYLFYRNNIDNTDNGKDVWYPFHLIIAIVQVHVISFGSGALHG